MDTAPIPPPAPFRMVVALDRSEYAEIVLEHALDQAMRHEDAEIHLITVQEHGKVPDEEHKNGLARMVREEMETFHADGRDWSARLHVRCGKPADEIAALAGEVGADLIVVGRFGVHASKSLLHLGSVAEQVLRRAPCPTLVVQLTDHGVEEQGCPACIAVRRESDGEAWFCKAHMSESVGLATIRFPIASGWNRGGPMW
jgi:nucleotide-binding universal stress UspA family protein